jgi:hypothetical protein
MGDSNSVSVGSPVGQNESPVSTGSHTQQSEPIGDKNRITCMALRRTGCAGLGEGGEEVGGYDGRKVVYVGRRHVVGDGGAEVAERSRDISVEV